MYPSCVSNFVELILNLALSIISIMCHAVAQITTPSNTSTLVGPFTL